MEKTQIAGSKGNGGRFGESCFKECGLSESSFDYADFSRSSWESCTIDGCRFRETFCSEAKLKKMKLKEVDFSRADFFKTPLKGLDFSACIIDGIQLSEHLNELRGMKIGAEQALALVRLLGVETA